VSPPGDSRPRYRKVADAIREDIESGRLQPGEAIPSVSEIEQTFDVSNATVQRAITHLRSLGLVESKHGLGTFVRERRPLIARSAAWMKPPGDGEPDFWTRQTADAGYLGRQDIVFIGTTTPPDDVRDALDLADGETVVMRSRVMYAGNDAVELVHAYYPHDVADGTPLASPQKIKGGTPRYLATLPEPPVEILEAVTARMPTDIEADALSLPSGTPVIQLFRSAITARGRAIDAVVQVLAADRYKLIYRHPV